MYKLWRGYKHCNFSTKIDSPPTANCETLQNFLQWLVITLSLKVWKQILGMTTMASKKEITVFHRNFREFNSSFDKVLQKFASILLLQIYLSSR